MTDLFFKHSRAGASVAWEAEQVIYWRSMVRSPAARVQISSGKITTPVHECECSTESTYSNKHLRTESSACCSCLLSTDCWGFLWVLGGSLPYNISLFEATVVMIWCYKNQMWAADFVLATNSMGTFSETLLCCLSFILALLFPVLSVSTPPPQKVKMNVLPCEGGCWVKALSYAGDHWSERLHLCWCWHYSCSYFRIQDICCVSKCWSSVRRSNIK